MVKPASQGGAGVHRAAQRAVGRIVLHAVHRVGQTLGTAGPADEQVELHVHQAGQQRDVAEVDLGRIVGQLGGIDRRDAVAVDHDHRRRAHLARVDVDPARRRAGR